MTPRRGGGAHGARRRPAYVPVGFALALLLGVGAAAPAPAQQLQDPANAMDPLLVQVIGFYTGAIGQVDDPRAHELLLEAAADGDALSRMWLARVYSRGRMLFEQDEARAREIASEVINDVRDLAAANHPEAAFLMGTAYAEGLGVETNQELALAWYYRAADLGSYLAQHNLGNAFREGDGVPLDAGIAAYWYRRAADQGDALPCFWLGQMYELGEGLPQDLAQALRWYRSAASRGRDDAKAALARLGG